MKTAILGYCYPPVLFDFAAGIKKEFNSMRDLETSLKSGLLSRELSQVKFALANIIFWGNIRTGYGSYRTNEFLSSVTQKQLQDAVRLFPTLVDDGLKEIRRIHLPQFSNMTFLSKLRMFLDPANYVTLDRKLAELKENKTRTLFSEIKAEPTYIPINERNCTIYRNWCYFSKSVAAKYFSEEEFIAVDVERGVFNLVDQGRLDLAAQIISEVGSMQFPGVSGVI